MKCKCLIKSMIDQMKWKAYEVKFINNAQQLVQEL